MATRLATRFPLYSRALFLYPRAYRQQYGEQMLQTLADMLDNSSSLSARIGVWLRMWLDLPLSALKQQLIAEAQVSAQETPAFVRRNIRFGALLLTPFFVFLVLDILTAHRLSHGWLWSEDVQWLWVALLPALAAIVGMATFLQWLFRREEQRGYAARLGDIRHSWPMVLLTVVSITVFLLVFFHGSTHCMVGNPLRELRHTRETLECIRQGQAA